MLDGALEARTFPPLYTCSVDRSIPTRTRHEDQTFLDSEWTGCALSKPALALQMPA